jgi:hypothetical protein
MGVFDNDGDQLPFTYTIGNSSRPTPMPELLVIGTARGGFLDDLSQMMIDNDAAFEDGQVVLIPGGRMPVRSRGRGVAVPWRAGARRSASPAIGRWCVFLIGRHRRHPMREHAPRAAPRPQG